MNLSSKSPGWTLVEVAAALSIFIICGGLLYTAAITAFPAIDRIIITARENAVLFQFHRAMKSACSRVAMPYWCSIESISQSGTEFAIPYIDGEEDRELVLNRSGNGLSIAIGEGEFILSDIQISAIDIQLSESTGTIEIIMMIELADENIEAVYQLGGRLLLNAERGE
ncbi:MAG: hypothetical protein ACLFR1_11155 [Spirochaetia bacterium]